MGRRRICAQSVSAKPLRRDGRRPDHKAGRDGFDSAKDCLILWTEAVPAPVFRNPGPALGLANQLEPIHVKRIGVRPC
jgi:hypothetical protein